MSIFKSSEISTIDEKGFTNIGSYSLVFPYYVAGKDYYAPGGGQSLDGASGPHGYAPGGHRAFGLWSAQPSY